MAKRNARSRKLKPRRASGAKKRTAKRATARKAARPARKTRAVKARRVQARNARPKPAALSRPRRVLHDEEIVIPSAPSTLGYAPKASKAESGHEKYHQLARQHSSEDQKLTGGDLDADWNEAYSSGEESPGGDMPTPDQDVVEEIGRALGVEYEDAEELKGSDKIVERDRHRWEYDPASAEDYRDRNKKQ
jgi:uncharacterized protein DUF6335